MDETQAESTTKSLARVGRDGHIRPSFPLPMKKIAQGLRWFWTQFPFAPLLVLVLALQLMEEFYPFSHFPMYQRFDEAATYLYLTNEKDEPIPMQTHFSYKGARLKKSFKNSLRDEAKKHDRKLETATEADMKAAGEEVLRELYKRALKTDARKLQKIPGSEVRLWHGLMTLKDDKFIDEKVELARMTLDRGEIDAAAAKKSGAPAPVEEADENGDEEEGE